MTSPVMRVSWHTSYIMRKHFFYAVSANMKCSKRSICIRECIYGEKSSLMQIQSVIWVARDEGLSTEK